MTKTLICKVSLKVSMWISMINDWIWQNKHLHVCWDDLVSMLSTLVYLRPSMCVLHYRSNYEDWNDISNTVLNIVPCDADATSGRPVRLLFLRRNLSDAVGRRWAVKLDVRDLDDHLDFNLRTRTDTLSKYIKDTTFQNAVVEVLSIGFQSMCDRKSVDYLSTTLHDIGNTTVSVSTLEFFYSVVVRTVWKKELLTITWSVLRSVLDVSWLWCHHSDYLRWSDISLSDLKENSIFWIFFTMCPLEYLIMIPFSYFFTSVRELEFFSDSNPGDWIRDLTSLRMTTKLFSNLEILLTELDRTRLPQSSVNENTFRGLAFDIRTSRLYLFHSSRHRYPDISKMKEHPNEFLSWRHYSMTCPMERRLLLSINDLDDWTLFADFCEITIGFFQNELCIDCRVELIRASWSTTATTHCKLGGLSLWGVSRDAQLQSDKSSSTNLRMTRDVSLEIRRVVCSFEV